MIFDIFEYYTIVICHMEKAILKTIIYADIFDYPLTVYEIHKWLIGKKATLRQVEKALEKLRVKGKAARVKEHFVLPGRSSLEARRKSREKQSKIFFWKATLIVWFLKFIPWIKLIGVSGGLAMGNAAKVDDIDLFTITSKNRLWISRLLALGFLSIIGQRRKVYDTGRKLSGKLCLNILLEEDRLAQYKGDIYLAHEVLQMKVLWQKDGIYSKYLSDNDWVFKFLPNWVGSNQDLRFMNEDLRMKNLKSKTLNHKSIIDNIEAFAKRFQLNIMKKPQGMERIENGALYFHPQDCRPVVLEKYKLRIKNL